MKDKYMTLVCEVLTSQDIAIKLLKSFGRATHPLTTYIGVKFTLCPNYIIKWILVPKLSDSEDWINGLIIFSPITSHMNQITRRNILKHRHWPLTHIRIGRLTVSIDISWETLQNTSGKSKHFLFIPFHWVNQFDIATKECVLIIPHNICTNCSMPFDIKLVLMSWFQWMYPSS